MRCFAGLKKGRTMNGAMVAFAVAVSGTSMVCYALMTRAERGKRHRRSLGDTTVDGGGTSGSEDWAVASWFGGAHSTTDSSGNPSDFGGGDSGGSGDGGGDGGGGGD
jgi:hypothetical protein